MGLWQVTYRGRTRVMYNDGPLQFPGSLTGVWVRKFQYEHHHFLPPSLLTIDNQKYMMPGWVKVDPKTTLKDCKHIKPIVKKETIEEFSFGSSSSNSTYTAKRFTKPNGEVKFNCTCPGVWRSKDRQCKYIKSIING